MADGLTPSQPAEATGVARSSRSSWIPDISNPEVLGFAAWCVATFALSMAATLAIEHRAVALPPSTHLPNHFLVSWAATWGGSMLVLAFLAGLLVFRRTTPWEIVLTWPWLVGPIVALAFFLALTGQMNGGSKLCDAPKNASCDNAWGLGAGLVAIAAALALGGTFIAVASLKRAFMPAEPR